MMHNNLNGRVALITGASRGIGAAVALTLARRGCDVALVARSLEGLQETALACEAYGGRALPLSADLSDRASHQGVVERCLEHFGRLDFLINNAGMSLGQPVPEMSTDALAQVMELNFMAAANLTRLALPSILKSEQGAVIQIGSIASKMSFPGSASYSASKHALLGYSHALFEDVREQGVKVSVICPGFVNTELIDQGRSLDRDKMLQPDDVSRAVLFVLSFTDTGCPTEIILRPQRSPYR